MKRFFRELWDIVKYFHHLEWMRFFDKYERYYPLKEEGEQKGKAKEER